MAYIEERKQDVYNFLETKNFQENALFLKEKKYRNYSYQITSVKPNHIKHGIDLTMYNGLYTYNVYNIPFPKTKMNIDGLSLHNKLTPYVNSLNNYYLSYARPRWTTYFNTNKDHQGFLDTIFFYYQGYVHSFQYWYNFHMSKRIFSTNYIYIKRKSKPIKKKKGKYKKRKIRKYYNYGQKNSYFLKGKKRKRKKYIINKRKDFAKDKHRLSFILYENERKN